jgi:hypothetical protein
VRSHLWEKSRKRGRRRRGWFDFIWQIKYEFGLVIEMQFHSPTIDIPLSSPQVVCKKNSSGCVVNLGQKGYCLDASVWKRIVLDRTLIKHLLIQKTVPFWCWNETDRAWPHVFTDSAILCFYKQGDRELFLDWFVTVRASEMLELQVGGEFLVSESQFQVTKLLPPSR